MVNDERYQFQESETRISVGSTLKKHNNATRNIWGYLQNQGWNFYGVVRDWSAVFRKDSYSLVLHHFVDGEPLKDLMGTPNHCTSWEDFFPEHAPLASLFLGFEQVAGESQFMIPNQAFIDAVHHEYIYGDVDWHLQSPKHKFQIWIKNSGFNILAEVFFNIDLPPYGVTNPLRWPDIDLEPEYGQLFSIEEMEVDSPKGSDTYSTSSEFMGIEESVNAELLLQAQQAIHKIFTDAKNKVIQTFSGGKDSTTCLQLCVDYLLEHPEHQEKFAIVAADTGVENPIITRHILAMRDVVVRTLNEKFVNGFKEDRFIIVRPALDDNYLTCVFGKGYTPPSMQNKWCVDRLKIRPAMASLMNFIDGMTEQATLILGVRSSESATRASSVEAHFGDDFYGEHALNSIRTAAPIVNWTATDVATYLVREKPPWSEEYSNFNLINIYGSAAGAMECPIGAMIANENDAVKSCSSSGARFGCFSCTVVKEDTSMKNLIDSYAELEPYYQMRVLLKATQDIRYGGRTGYQRKRSYASFGSGFGDLTIDMRTILLEKWYQFGIPMAENEVMMIDRIVKEREISEGIAVTKRFREALYRLLPTNPVFFGSMNSPIWDPIILIDDNGKQIEQHTSGVDRVTQEDIEWISRYQRVREKIKDIQVDDHVKLVIEKEWLLEAVVEAKPSDVNALVIRNVKVVRNTKDATAIAPAIIGSLKVSIPLINEIDLVRRGANSAFHFEEYFEQTESGQLVFG